MFDGELSFALKLAREMGRPDWRAMLAGMSSTEYADWHRFYSTHYFHDVLLDMHFSGLTYTVLSRWRIEQCSELSAVSASFVLSTPTETDGAVFPGRIMLANTCTWTYRGDECGYHGPAVADEYDQLTSDITKDKCSKCLSGCKFRNNVGNFGGFLSINKLSQ
ncbi:TPA: phage minor tail protein L [Escherichia coli]|nr:phage minor tail protein L [Escherichia coli]